MNNNNKMNSICKRTISYMFKMSEIHYITKICFSTGTLKTFINSKGITIMTKTKTRAFIKNTHFI